MSSFLRAGLRCSSRKFGMTDMLIRSNAQARRSPARATIGGADARPRLLHCGRQHPRRVRACRTAQCGPLAACHRAGRQRDVPRNEEACVPKPTACSTVRGACGSVHAAGEQDEKDRGCRPVPAAAPRCPLRCAGAGASDEAGRLVVPFAWRRLRLTARVLAQRWAMGPVDRRRQQAGANGVVGIEAVAKSQPTATLSCLPIAARSPSIRACT